MGGLGSAVCDAICNKPVPVLKLGVNDQFGTSGPAGDLLKLFGLCAENIAVMAKKAIALK